MSSFVLAWGSGCCRSQSFRLRTALYSQETISEAIIRGKTGRGWIFQYQPILNYRVFIKYCAFPKNFVIFPNSASFAGDRPAICGQILITHTLGLRESRRNTSPNPESRIDFKFFEKTQYLINTLHKLSHHNNIARYSNILFINKMTESKKSVLICATNVICTY